MRNYIPDLHAGVLHGLATNSGGGSRYCNPQMGTPAKKEDELPTLQ